MADFIGDANLVDAEVTAERGLTVVVRVGDVEFELPAPAGDLGPVTLAIRPDAIRMHENRPAGEPDPIRTVRGAGYSFDETYDGSA